MADKDTFFYNKNLLNCNGKLLDISSPVIMGILNVSENSFYDGGKYKSRDSLLKQVEKMLSEGAQIIDIGACSTKPGSVPLPEKEERKNLVEAIENVIKKFPDAIISADTFRSGVAKHAIAAGASIINDISGGSMDEKMFETIALLKVPYILMHIKGIPATMQENPQYQNIETEVMDYFIQKIHTLKNMGITDIIIDPGFGFAKNLEHNFQLMRKLDDFKILGYPILAGVSRKSMINKVLKTNPSEALNGTSILNTIALMNGAQILRVHDIKEAMEAIKLWKFYHLN